MQVRGQGLVRALVPGWGQVLVPEQGPAREQGPVWALGLVRERGPAQVLVRGLVQVWPRPGE